MTPKHFPVLSNGKSLNDNGLTNISYSFSLIQQVTVRSDFFLGLDFPSHKMDVSLLREIFPSIRNEVLLSTLKSSNGNVEMAIDKLLNFPNTPSEPPKESKKRFNQQTSPTRKTAAGFKKPESSNLDSDLELLEKRHKVTIIQLTREATNGRNSKKTFRRFGTTKETASGPLAYLSPQSKLKDIQKDSGLGQSSLCLCQLTTETRANFTTFPASPSSFSKRDNLQSTPSVTKPMEIPSDPEKVISHILQAKTLYQRLFISTNATEKEIQTQYKKVTASILFTFQLALLVHPDKNDSLKSEEAFKAISESFCCLSNSEERKKYDVGQAIQVTPDRMNAEFDQWRNILRSHLYQQLFNSLFSQL